MLQHCRRAKRHTPQTKKDFTPSIKTKNYGPRFKRRINTHFGIRHPGDNACIVYEDNLGLHSKKENDREGFCQRRHAGDLQKEYR